MGGFLPCKEGEGKRRRREVTSHTQDLQRQRALSKRCETRPTRTSWSGACHAPGLEWSAEWRCSLERQRDLGEGMTESAVAGLAPLGRFVVSFLKGGTQA